MRRIAVFTSGGNTPGIYAALRATVLSVLDNGWEVFEVCYGYTGLISGLISTLGSRGGDHSA